MAISAKELDTAIKDALADYNGGAYKNEGKTPRHLKVLGDTMKDYFENNTEITYTWAAVLPPPASTPDPVVTFDSTVSFPSFDLTPAQNLDMLALLIQKAFVSAVINHPGGFAVAPGSFLAILPPTLGRAASLSGADTAIYICICIPVCAWALTLINPSPLSGSHAAFAGATTGMVIA
jgi:hypothetical protein